MYYALILETLIALCSPCQAHESPMDHVERTLRLWVEGGRLHLSYRIELTERAVLMQFHRMNKDGNGSISQNEQTAYFQLFREELGNQLKVAISGRELPLRPEGEVRLSAGLRQTCTFSASLADLPAGKLSGELRDLYSQRHPGSYRYVPKAASGLQVSEPPKLAKIGNHPEMIVLKFVVFARAGKE